MEEKILLVPFGDVDAEVLDYLKSTLGEVFKCDVEISKTQTIPAQALDRSRGQYHSTEFLKVLLGFVGDDERMLGIVDEDLYAGDLNFVFGEADLYARVCVISVTRLYPEFYGKEPNRDVFLERVLKEAVHELGHTYGLRHCPNTRCVMHFSDSLGDTDSKGHTFCPRCRKKFENI